MENSTNIRRKAQKLTQKGAYAEAVAEYEKLAQMDKLEPYDLVVYADLLNRGGRRDEAVTRYLEAMDSYTESGLHRNAIALGKKIQRLAPHMIAAHRKLGDLYAADGLSSESCLHYLEYLERVDLGKADEAEGIREICGKLLELSLPSFDIVERIVEKVKSIERPDILARGVMEQAFRASAVGNAEAENKLKTLARGLDPQVASVNGNSHAAAADSGPMVQEPGVVDLDQTAEPEPRAPEAPAAPRQEESLSLDDFSYEGEEDSEPAGIDAASPMDPGPEVEMPSAAETPVPAHPTESGEEYRTRALKFMEQNDPVRAQRELMLGAKAFFEAAQSREAAELYELVIKIDPNHIEALRGLVEIAHINGEKAKMAYWGCELGDVLLARERHAEAKTQFEQVLAFDPGNEKAKSRVKRLNTIAGVKAAGFGQLSPAASEVQGAQVSIRDEDTNPSSQSALDLTQILDEFRASVIDNIPAEDSQSHYDLGMTYKEMGLLEEAVQEFEISSASEENRLASIEMLGECYLLLDRSEDVIRVLQEVLTMGDEESRARAYCNLGRAHEALGQWDLAEESYHQALERVPGFEDASELLRELEDRRERGAA